MTRGEIKKVYRATSIPSIKDKYKLYLDADAVVIQDNKTKLYYKILLDELYEQAVELGIQEEQVYELEAQLLCPICRSVVDSRSDTCEECNSKVHWPYKIVPKESLNKTSISIDRAESTNHETLKPLDTTPKIPEIPKDILPESIQVQCPFCKNVQNMSTNPQNVYPRDETCDHCKEHFKTEAGRKQLAITNKEAGEISCPTCSNTIVVFKDSPTKCKHCQTMLEFNGD